MTFKEIKAGFPVYLFHRDESIRLVQGKCVSVSNPRFPNNAGFPNFNGVSFNNTPTQQQVVDVTIDENGTQKTYTIPENLDMTYAGNDLVLSTSLETIMREIEATKLKADEIVSSVERNKAISQACATILTDFNPVYKAKKENDERFEKMENQIGGLSDMLKDLLKKLS